MPKVAASSDSQRFHRELLSDWAAVVLVVVPGRVAVVLPLLLIARLLLVVFLILLLSPGLLLPEVLFGSLKDSLLGGRPAADVDHQRTVRIGILRRDAK